MGLALILNTGADCNIAHIFFQLSVAVYDFMKSAVFKIRSETCQTEKQFCQNLYVIKNESLPDRPKFCRSVVRGPAIILKTESVD